MFRSILLALILLLGPASVGATSAGAADTPPVVAVTGGWVSGAALDGGGVVFKGIPFAQPPVGDLRWREPLPVQAWTGARDATAFAAECGFKGSEDCLYVNVWAPAWPVKTRLPVMLWIPGGGNFTGATSDPRFDGTSLARRGVVLVSAAYRLGIFGFFSHPALTRESPHHSSGNYGLLDQIAALHWVHDNVARFGGDPDNVTIFGESAASLDINVLLTSPLARGLFRRAIGESGPAVDPPSLADGEQKGLAVAAALHVDGGDELKQLRGVSAADLWKIAPPGLKFLGPDLGVVVDGWVLPASPFAAFAAGRQAPVALMLGNNARELQKPFFPEPGGIDADILALYGPLAARARTLYGIGATSEPPPDPLYGAAWPQFATDSQFRCGTVGEVTWHSAAGYAAYEFQFDRVAPGKEALGAVHASELPYVFGTLGPAYDAVDRQVSAAMQQYWTNFAKTGDPNGGALPHWPKFDPVNRAFIEFTDAGPVAGTALRRPFCDLYNENVKRQMALAAAAAKR